MSFERLQFFSEKQKKEIINLLKENFGITDIPGKIIKRGAERLFLYTGSLNEEEIKLIEKTLPVERVGIYFAKIIEDKNSEIQIRLSIDGAHILKEQIKNNIFELNPEQAEKYLKGEELYIKIPKEQQRFLVMKYQDDFWGCGKASAEKISNFIPKGRRKK